MGIALLKASQVSKMLDDIDNRMQEKQLTVLRRKFLVGIPSSMVIGYLAARQVSAGMRFGRWPSRFVKLTGLVVSPILASMTIVHFNKAEIFRIGSNMMKGMKELREREEGPFADPAVREQWDKQMGDRKFQQFFRTDPNIEKEYEGLNYKQIVDESVKSDRM